MKFENAFDVRAPVGDVWEALIDVERVAPCMPGAEVLERLGDDSYRVGISVKIGPISMRYRGQVEIVERDEPTRQATMRAKAKEARGQGTADARVHIGLVEQSGGTRATIETELQLSGKAASMGRGVIADVSAKLIEEFAGNLARMLEPAAVASAPTDGGTTPPAPAPDVATAFAPAAAAATPSAPAPEPGPPLAVGKLAAGVIAQRLTDPRTLVISAATLAAVFGAIGYAIGRAR